MLRCQIYTNENLNLVSRFKSRVFYAIYLYRDYNIKLTNHKKTTPKHQIHLMLD